MPQAATLTLGLDFGTTFSAMSVLDPQTGKPKIIRNEQGDEKTPTIILFEPTEHHIGSRALNRLEDAIKSGTPEDAFAVQQATVMSIKSFLDVQHFMQAVRHRQPMLPCDIVAMFLEHFKKTAEKLYFHEKIDSLRLTYPVHFETKQFAKDNLRRAATKAGFKQVELLCEPVAAVLGYCADSPNVGENILVYDVGGGTFDLAFVNRQGSEFNNRIVPPRGTKECSGDEFDRLLYEHLGRECQRQHGFGFDVSAAIRNLPVLLECRKVRVSLSENEQATFSFFFETHSRNVKLTVKRSDYEVLIKPLVSQTLEHVREMSAAVQALGYPVDTVLLIGGVSRTPLIRSELARLHQEGVLPVLPTATQTTDVAVALGAALEDRKRTEPESPDPEIVQPTLPPPDLSIEEEVERRVQERLEQIETEAARKSGGRSKVLTMLGVKYPFRLCPPGTFMMGSPKDENGRFDNEPQHQVTLTQEFWMLETPVTQEMWESVMGSNPSQFKGDKRLPVENVSWDDCQAFIDKLNTQFFPSTERLSLPTEAQWEYACRAGTRTALNNGKQLRNREHHCPILNEIAWYDWQNKESHTHEVGLKQPNSWGLYDMHDGVGTA